MTTDSVNAQPTSDDVWKLASTVLARLSRSLMASVLWLTPAGAAVRERHPVPSVFVSALCGASAASLTQSFVKLLGCLFKESTPGWLYVEVGLGLATCAPLE